MLQVGGWMGMCVVGVWWVGRRVVGVWWVGMRVVGVGRWGMLGTKSCTDLV